MLSIKITNKYDKIFVDDNFNFDRIKDKVVTIIQKESDIIDALTSKNEGEFETIRISKLLIDGPELFKVTILGLDIDVALLENLCNNDILNPEWEVFFKINMNSGNLKNPDLINSSKLKNVGIIYNTSTDGKESFNYNTLLHRLALVIKEKTSKLNI